MTTDVNRHQPKFWPRQLQVAPTRGQVVFDIAFGLVLPAVCLVVDPLVFRGRDPLLRGYFAISEAAILLGFVSLPLWLRFRWFPGIFAGVLLGVALFAFGLGVILLPMSIVGLGVFFLGTLGLIPFGTAFVFFRNGIRAYRQAGVTESVPVVLVFACTGLMLSVGGPCYVQSVSERWLSIESISRLLWFLELAITEPFVHVGMGLLSISMGLWVIGQYRRLENGDKLPHCR